MVFKQDWKTATKSLEVTSSGRLLQTRAAASGKVWSLTADGSVRLTIMKTNWNVHGAAKSSDAPPNIVKNDKKYFWIKTFCTRNTRNTFWNRISTSPVHKMCIFNVDFLNFSEAKASWQTYWEKAIAPLPRSHPLGARSCLAYTADRNILL